jgi:serine protease Do
MNARPAPATFLRPRLAAIAAALALSLVAALGAAGSASAASPGDATEIERATARTEPAIVRLEIVWAGTVYDTRNEKAISEEAIVAGPFGCTGFFVNGQGYIGTAGHCVTYDEETEAALKQAAAETAYKNGYYEEGTTLEAILEAAKTDYVVTEHSAPVIKVSFSAQMSGISTKSSLTARTIAAKTYDEGDVALLKIEATNTPALTLAPDASIQIGEHDISIGYPGIVLSGSPETLSPSFKDGTISSQQVIQDGTFKVYETSAAIGSGMSGGPTIDGDGNVIGINSYSAASGAPFSFIRPSAFMQELLDSQGVKNTVDPTQQEYVAGVDAYYAGNGGEAVEHFDNVLDVVPSHSFALRFRLLAKATAVSSSHTLRNALVVAALLLAGGLGAGALVLRRRGKGDDGPVAPGHSAAAPSTSVPGRYALVVDATDERHVIDRKVVVGREGADISVDDLEASRRHATICALATGGLEISDLDSANGTFVNDVRIGDQPRPLENGDVIRCGRSVLRVEGPASAAERLRMATVIKRTD